MGNLTALAVKNAKPGDKLGDGDGLRLDVDKNGNRSWVFRYTSPTTGKERYAGFGSADAVTLADARDARDEARKLIRAGQDPIELRNTKRAEAKVQDSRAVTFQVYAEGFISGRESGWKNDKHRQQWRNSLRDYAYPIIGHLPVGPPAPNVEARRRTRSRARPGPGGLQACQEPLRPCPASCRPPQGPCEPWRCHRSDECRAWLP
jgi:hypothetical protein